VARSDPSDTRRRDQLAQLYREQHDVVLHYLLRRTDPDTAQDLVTETFLVAWRRWEAIPLHTSGWLCAVARRLLANERKADRRRQTLVARLASEPTTGPLTPEEQALGGTGAVRAALSRLSEAEREVLMLAAWDRFRPADGAAVLGCSPQAYAVRLHRARNRLARMLDSDRPATAKAAIGRRPSEVMP
jgi:RNA polymerase sigma-70 factor (ECF subfamily)